MAKKTLCLTIVLSLAAALLSLPCLGDEKADYRDPDLPLETRVQNLLDRMTLEEKIAQLVCIWGDKNLLLDDDGRFADEKAIEAIPLGVGAVARPSDNWQRIEMGVEANRTARETVELVNSLQRFLIEETRLGIPALLHEEGLHGMQARGATSFPQAIALASTWDPELVEEVYSIVAREIRAWGSHHVLSPVVDVARDPRWGRIEETYGEDPHLVAEMGIAAVRGFQGESLPLGEGKVLATLKHMTGHGQPESGTNIGPASISERVLREIFFPPFERAIREAGAYAVMASYNEIDGVPSHANSWLLGDVLRKEWGFEGMVVADYYAIGELMNRHHVASSQSDAAIQALRAGVDIELPNPSAFPTLLQSAARDESILPLIDLAVARLLRAKFLAGLFEAPYADADYAETITDNEEARALATRAAEKAITLLKNEGDLLPLDPDKKQRIAVIGPHADEALLGGYSDVPRHTISILEGIEARVGEDVEILHTPGVGITEARNWFGDEVVLIDPESNLRSIEEARQLATTVDLAILVVGDNEQTSREAWAESHLGDRDDVTLVGQQNELVQAVVETGVPTVVVLIHGRPLAVNYIAEHVPAILDGWYLGQETGTAVARALFGDINPGGKLPVTIPRSVGQLPVFYNRKPTARRGYLFSSTEPLWPFGFGLSYTEFEIREPSIDRSQIPVGASAELSLVIENTGSRPGDEVVQIYLRDRTSSVTRPLRELVAFERVTLEPGESKTLSFSIGPSQLAFYDRSMERVVEPGEFELHIGTSSDVPSAGELAAKSGEDDGSQPLILTVVEN